MEVYLFFCVFFKQQMLFSVRECTITCFSTAILKPFCSERADSDRYVDFIYRFQPTLSSKCLNVLFVFVTLCMYISCYCTMGRWPLY